MRFRGWQVQGWDEVFQVVVLRLSWNYLYGLVAGMIYIGRQLLIFSWGWDSLGGSFEGEMRFFGQ